MFTSEIFSELLQPLVTVFRKVELITSVAEPTAVSNLVCKFNFLQDYRASDDRGLKGGLVPTFMH